MQQNVLSAASKQSLFAIQTSLAGKCFASTGQTRPSSRMYARSQRNRSSPYAQTDFLSSLLASPVKTSAWQVSKPVTMVSAVSFSMRSSVWLGSFDLTSSCLKTLEIYYPTKTGKPSKKPSSRLPKQGTMRNGRLFQQVTWEPVTVENASGLLPTPTTRDYKDSGPNVNYQKAAEKSRLPGAIVVQCSAQNGGGYLSSPVLRRGDDGLRNRVDRLKQLGNSIVPQVAAVPLRRIKEMALTN